MPQKAVSPYRREETERVVLGESVCLIRCVPEADPAQREEWERTLAALLDQLPGPDR